MHSNVRSAFFSKPTDFSSLNCGKEPMPLILHGVKHSGLHRAGKLLTLIGRHLALVLHIDALVLERKQRMVQQRLGFVSNLSRHQQAIRHLSDPSDRLKPRMPQMSSTPFAYGVGCSPGSSYFLSANKISFKKPLPAAFFLNPSSCHCEQKSGQSPQTLWTKRLRIPEQRDQ